MEIVNKISVVVPTLITNNSQRIMSEKCISLARECTEIDFELVIVETGSNYLREYSDIYIYEREITSATISINRGFKCSSGEFVVLLTNDVFVSNGWLESLYECFNNNEDCGASCLATTQFSHNREDKIEEGIWFSLAMIPKKYAIFDERYVDSWDDSDLLMNVYKDGLKMYRNFGCVVEHDPGKTQYSKPNHRNNFDKNRDLFQDKWKDSGDSRLYNIFMDGTLV